MDYQNIIENQKPLTVQGSYPTKYSNTAPPVYKGSKATVNEPYKYYDWKAMQCAECDNYDRAYFKSYDPNGVDWKELEGQYKCPTDIECITCKTDINNTPLGVTKPSLLNVSKHLRKNYKLDTPDISQLKDVSKSIDTTKTFIITSVISFILLLLFFIV